MNVVNAANIESIGGFWFTLSPMERREKLICRSPNPSAKATANGNDPVAKMAELRSTSSSDHSVNNCSSITCDNAFARHGCCFTNRYIALTFVRPESSA